MLRHPGGSGHDQKVVTALDPTLSKAFIDLDTVGNDSVYRYGYWL